MKILFDFLTFSAAASGGGRVQQSLQVKPTSRGVRVWLEGRRLSDHGFLRHARYTREVSNGKIVYRLDPAGDLKVAGRTRNGKDLPIIDFSAKEITGFAAGDNLTAVYQDGLITITKAEG